MEISVQSIKNDILKRVLSLDLFIFVNVVKLEIKKRTWNSKHLKF